MGYQKDLTRRQQQVLDYVRAEVHKKGYPPSVREIGEALGLSSSSTVHSHLAALEAKGYIRRDPTKPRALEIFDYRDGDIGFEVGAVSAVPVVGQVAAGMPILAAENIEQTLPLPTEFSGDQTFILRVKGESMIEAGILPGDFVVVRQQQTATNGDIVVAMIDDEATIKTYYRESDRIRLQPQNSSMEPIYSTDVTILGKAVALLRRI